MRTWRFMFQQRIRNYLTRAKTKVPFPVWYDCTMKRSSKFTVLIERDEEGYYIATVPALRGCHTQAKNLDTLMKRVREAIALCLKSDASETTPLELVGIQQVTV